ncbi:MAG: chemotaxis protein CheA [Clostridiales Family XIII bacterium]|jgi:two-component system chemotaxis sensor kinase CheA|nr:chemotaxis protein CheA [Clostridiales Family XIII bacterium]
MDSGYSNDFNNDSLLDLYIFEATALIDGLDGILLNAEQSRTLRADDVNEIFRIMHTIKGSSSMMEFDTLSSVAHSTEGIFSAVRDNGTDDSDFEGLFNVALMSFRFLAGEIAKLQDGAELSKGAPELISKLDAYAKSLGGEAPREVVVDTAQREAAVDAADIPVAPEGGRILGIEPAADMPFPKMEVPESLDNEPEPPEPFIGFHTAPAPAPVAQAAEPPQQDGENTVFLHVHFNEGARMENIRAFMLANKLSEFGTVNSTVPSDLENNVAASGYIIENGFYISFTSNMFREQIGALAKGTLSVESVSFVRRLPNDDTTGSTPNTPARENGETRVAKPAPAPVLFAELEAALPITKHAPITEQAPAPTPAQSIAPEPAPAPPQAQPTEPAPAPDKAQTQVPDLHAPAKQSLISVDATKLDTLLDLVGEIVINESMLTENPELSTIDPHRLESFNKAAHRLGKLTDELQDSVMSVRMVPVQSTFQRLRRGVRDISKQLGKDVELVIMGETTEVDKAILDAIGDPIMHLVRNALDHAIELPDERAAAGKSRTGHITLSAQNIGSEVIISVSDDGRGIDRDRVLAKAESKGMLKKHAAEYDARELAGLLIEPGFSTNDEVTEYSGRGVGLDVVKMNIERLGGAVIIESADGLGTNVLLKIPLTLAITDCMELRLGKEVFAIPVNNVIESFRSDAGQLVTDPTGREMMILRGVVYPIVRLYEKLNIGGAVENIDDGMLILVDSVDRKGCLLVDEVIGKFQVVVKSVPAYLNEWGVGKSGFSGCTIMGNGDVSLILDAQGLIS